MDSEHNAFLFDGRSAGDAKYCAKTIKAVLELGKQGRRQPLY